ncbi:MAG: STAS/SEC14 domain-containing protein [Chloroflexi bacterium]|nr:STAS/SEC14 domain-containing protein [Chloroflexota bacterium]
MSTVTATMMEGLPAAELWWAAAVKREDVIPAFKVLLDLLNQTPQPLCILVDLRERPTFPLTDTLRGALDGVFQHHKLDKWLVVGSTPLAQTIGRTLSAITRRNNILWFKTYDEAIAFLRQHETQDA